LKARRGQIGMTVGKGDEIPWVCGAEWVAVISAKNHKRQSVTAKREKSQTPKVLTAILT